MPFGLYLHFPFCRHKCGYCDFYKEHYDSLLESRFYDALCIESELAAQTLHDRGYRIATLYIGGGTPSLTTLDRFRAWLEKVYRLFPHEEEIEFSFEINPESCSRGLLQALLEIGVNRPVFGVQSFDSGLLKLLSRKHELQQVHEAVYLANALGYDNYGCDLLYAMPGQTGKMLSSDLDQMTDLGPPHISFYQLTAEEGTELDRMVKRGKVKLPDLDFAQTLYSAGYEHFKARGYERYEVCSFVRADQATEDVGQEPRAPATNGRTAGVLPYESKAPRRLPAHACRHNLNYWTGGEYLGLGPAAHSFIDGRRFSNVANLYEYMETLEHGRRPTIEDRSGEKERIFEAIMLGLRTARGIDRASFERRFHRPLSDLLDPSQYDLLLNSGHLVDTGDFLRLSDEALILADEITQRLAK
ncbi:MAG: coproporphyrinogen-III oxidase family protein [Candidatus Zixiibacteriota bacterium]